MISDLELLSRLVLTAVPGSVIGFESKRLNCAAGLRTHMPVFWRFVDEAGPEGNSPVQRVRRCRPYKVPSRGRILRSRCRHVGSFSPRAVVK